MHLDRGSMVSRSLTPKRLGFSEISTATRDALSAGQYEKVVGPLPDIFDLCWRFPGNFNLGIRADIFHL